MTVPGSPGQRSPDPCGHFHRPGAHGSGSCPGAMSATWTGPPRACASAVVGTPTDRVRAASAATAAPAALVRVFLSMVFTSATMM